jgi:hypothetical protein
MNEFVTMLPAEGDIRGCQMNATGDVSRTRGGMTFDETAGSRPDLSPPAACWPVMTRR